MNSRRIKITTISLTILLFTFVHNAQSSQRQFLIQNYEHTTGGINLINALKIFRKKRDVVVAVIDTGIDYEHPYLKRNIYVPFGKSGSGNFGADFSFKYKSTTTPFDYHGHGTHVAGIIKSVFNDVRLLPLKYYNPQSSGPENLKATIKALKFAVDANVDIINYSGGGPEPSLEELRVLKIAEKKGILVICAAGNEHSNIDQKENAYYPASYGLSNIITVGAHDSSTNILPSSNWGATSVDISAPGKDINSTVPPSSSSKMTGTSQATAFVTGVVALIKSNFPKLSMKDIRKTIVISSTKTNSQKKQNLAKGVLNAKNSLVFANYLYSKQNTLSAKAR
ncbi:S8 family serine peptidase [Bacteriovoracaceae bacterium]|nr:S8 family serine peptidase [Bacteriovoracaceae bacterium]